MSLLYEYIHTLLCVLYILFLLYLYYFLCILLIKNIIHAEKVEKFHCKHYHILYTRKKIT